VTRTVAVVLGGGTGTRFGAPQPKQLLTLDGKTLVEHCVAAFTAAPGVDEVLLVMPSVYRDEAAKLVGDRVSAIIEGGKTRADSVRNALNHVAARHPADSTGILLHDAARPLIEQRVIADCVEALGEHDAIGAAVPTADTIVVCSGDGVMEHCPPRETLMRCQTPQCFRLSVIMRAHELAAADPDNASTDDCGVMLRYLPDVPVHIVKGSERNIKVTYPGDLSIAEVLLRTLRLGPDRLGDQGAAEVPHQPRPLARVVEHVGEGVEEQLDLDVTDDQRGDQLDDFHVVAGHLRQDAVPLEQRDHDHLRE
jgi:2-C-methyl-D-erythritol 4-phosphate cytidylyltransferase